MKEKLEQYYKKYNRQKYIHPDPLEFLYHYKDNKDIEIVAIIASSLAFGRVDQILKSISSVLDIMGDSPFSYLQVNSFSAIKKDFKGFVYRFVRDKEIVSLLTALKTLLTDYRSLEDCFSAGVSEQDETIFNGLVAFEKAIRNRADGSPGYLFADPSKGSGCKRMNLCLRWLVRKDSVDTGIWKTVSPSKLIIPVDTHMHKIAQKLNLTKRKQPNMKTALEITRGFAAISPDDPVKYDFSLTRFGIRNELSLKDI